MSCPGKMTAEKAAAYLQGLVKCLRECKDMESPKGPPTRVRRFYMIKRPRVT